MTLQALMDQLTENVLVRFREDGELRAPVWLMETAKGEMIVVMTPIGPDDDKNALAAAMRALLKQHDAHRYAFAMEMWFATETKETVKNSPPPSQRFDRSEGIMVTAEDRNGETRTVIYEIERKGATVTLKPPEAMNASVGRFANLLQTEQ